METKGNEMTQKPSITSTMDYPEAEVNALINFAAENSKADLSNVQVNAKNSKNAYGGMAYHGVPKMSKATTDDKEFLVTIRIGKPYKFPCDNMGYELKVTKFKNGSVRKKKVPTHPYGGKSAPHIVYNDWKEGLIAVAAHEFNHIYQYQNDMPRSEVECEKEAARVLELYRRAT